MSMGKGLNFRDRLALGRLRLLGEGSLLRIWLKEVGFLIRDRGAAYLDSVKGS